MERNSCKVYGEVAIIRENMETFTYPKWEYEFDRRVLKEASPCVKGKDSFLLKSYNFKVKTFDHNHLTHFIKT
jgi:hypothetical protein